MAGERRYKEDEVREIFEAATDVRNSSSGALTASDGLSLAELQEIGEEVGLTPERIAKAATALDVRRNTPPSKSYFGVPLTVSRMADLPRAPTDREWELLVAELRATFQAQGTIDSHGSLRHWSNGNLTIAIEPTETGHRLRMHTLKGNVMAMGVMGATAVGMSLFLTFALAAKERLADEFMLAIFFAAMGLGVLVAAALSLPKWARTRGEQMDDIAARAQALLAAPASPEPGDPEG